MENCAICGKELVLGCEGRTICKEHLNGLRAIFERGKREGAEEERKRCVLIAKRIEDKDTYPYGEIISEAISSPPIEVCPICQGSGRKKGIS